MHQREIQVLQKLEYKIVFAELQYAVIYRFIDIVEQYCPDHLDDVVRVEHVHLVLHILHKRI